MEIRGIEFSRRTNVDEPLQHSQQLVFRWVPAPPDQFRAFGQSLGRAVRSVDCSAAVIALECVARGGSPGRRETLFARFAPSALAKSDPPLLVKSDPVGGLGSLS